MMVRRLAATGFTPAHSPKREIRLRGAIRRTLRVWVCIRDGDGPGPRIAVCSTIARRVTWTASPGILRENKSGGTKANKNGLATTYRTSRSIPNQRSHGPVHHESGGRRTTV